MDFFGLFEDNLYKTKANLFREDDDFIKEFNNKIDFSLRKGFNSININENKDEVRFSFNLESGEDKKYYSDKNNYYIKRDREKIAFYKPYFFICSKCNEFPLIDIINLNLLKVSCACITEMIAPNLFFQKYQQKTNKILDFIKNYLKCQQHKKKYKFYCETCNRDICKKCLNNKKHKGHSFKIFDFLIFDFNIKIQTIFTKIYYSRNKILLDQKFKDIYKLIKVITANYKKYQNYNVFRTVSNIYNFLLFNIENKDSNTPVKELKITKLKEINNRLNNPYLITSIIISRQKLINLENICKADLINLDVLELPNNNINDISPLKNAKFINLKHLNLCNNKIDGHNIVYFEDIYFKYLSHMNLTSNLITDFEIFEKLKNFSNLNLNN